MKISVLTLNYYPELTGIGVYSTDFAQYMMGLGHEMRVITTFPYYPMWKRYPSYRLAISDKECVNNVDIHRLWTFVPSRPSSLKRIIHEVVFALMALIFLFRTKTPDLLIAISPPFFGMVAAALASKLRKMPLHIHIQDLQPDAAIDLGMIHGSLLKKLLYWMESFAYSRAQLISAVGLTMLSRIASKGVPQAKLLHFPNWITLTDKTLRQDATCAKPEWMKKWEGDFVVLYAGSMGEKQGLETLIEAAELAQINSQAITFLLAGDGSKRSDLKAMSDQKVLKNVHFLDVLPPEHFAALLLRADVSLILQREEVKDIVVPSKLMNILASGSPLIASVNKESETAKILAKISVNTMVSPSDPKALFEKILEYREHPEVVKILSEEEKRLANDLFDRDAILDTACIRIEAEFLPRSDGLGNCHPMPQ